MLSNVIPHNGAQGITEARIDYFNILSACVVYNLHIQSFCLVDFSGS